jgi:hypothetical protein
VGAAAPEIVRLYKQVTRTPPGTQQFTWQYLLVSGLFVGLGGFVGVILTCTDDMPWKPFVVGAGLPLVISSIAESAGRGAGT